MADQGYVFTFVNERLCEMLGYSREEMLGRQIVEFVHEDYKDFMQDQMARRQGAKQEVMKSTGGQKTVKGSTL